MSLSERPATEASGGTREAILYIIPVIGHYKYTKHYTLKCGVSLPMRSPGSGAGVHEHDPWMKQGPGDPIGDGNQLPLSAEDLYARSTRHLRQVDGAAGANQRCVFVGCGHAGH